MTPEERIDAWAARSMYGRGAWEAAWELGSAGMLPGALDSILEEACCRGINPLARVTAAMGFDEEPKP